MIALSYWSARSSNTLAGGSSHFVLSPRNGRFGVGLWLVLHALLYAFGACLACGPDIFGETRAAIIGLQLLILVAVGVCTFQINSASLYLSYVLFGAFNLLCMLGALEWMNYNEPIWFIDHDHCNAYFDSVAPDEFNLVTPAPPEITRCDDTGFLQFLRVIGLLATLTTAITTTVALLCYTSDGRVERRGKDSADTSDASA